MAGEENEMAKFMAAAKIHSDIDMDKWLKISYILPTDNTQPRPPQPKPLRNLNHSKPKDVISFDRLDQAISNYIDGVCHGAIPIQTPPCPNGHPAQSAWWWRHRCQHCQSIWKMRVDYVMKQPKFKNYLRKLQIRVPDAFMGPADFCQPSKDEKEGNSRLAATQSTTTGKSVSSHSLSQTKRYKRAEGAEGAKFVKKFPYNCGRPGADTNMDTFTGPVMYGRRNWLNFMARGVPDPWYYSEGPQGRKDGVGGLGWMVSVADRPAFRC